MSVLVVIGEEVGGEGVRVWPGKGEVDHHSLVVNSCWQPEALTVTGIQQYPGMNHWDTSYISTAYIEHTGVACKSTLSHSSGTEACKCATCIRACLQ